MEQAENTITLFILEETKVTIFYFSKEYCEWLLRTKYCVYYKFILVGHIFMIKMTQYNSIHLKLSNSLFKKLKSTTWNKTGITFRLSSSMISNINYEINFSHKLLLFTDWKVSMFSHAFVSSLSANIKLCKSWLSKITQLGGFPGKLPKFL